MAYGLALRTILAGADAPAQPLGFQAVGHVQSVLLRSTGAVR